jgi:puromycin-sensitive aminopeptidase
MSGRRLFTTGLERRGAAQYDPRTSRQGIKVTNPYRLPSTIVPTAYRIRLVPDLEAATFTGEVEVDVEVSEPVTTISLNAMMLELSPATFRSGSVEVVSADPILDGEYQTADFSFDAPLPVGIATISLSFAGILNDLLVGFYLSTYEDAEGVTHRIATTHFESTDARQAFPCWDEPAFKATFEVTLDIPEHLQAYSNAAEVSSTPSRRGRREVRFAPTMVMSTYLVAFVVGPFEASPVTIVAGTPVRVVYPVGKGHLVAWPMEVAVHSLNYFADYFDIPYPGDKLDLVAIPDFATGAMENLGCVTFRETELLIDPETASLAELQRVALVVGHELAHMWFGDLVTMEWWEGIWLNEAFATFMEMLCTDHFRPEWKKWVGFNPGRDVALLVDGQHSTRPIEFEVVSPNECRAMFDILTYVKGCAVLRMLEQYLGEETFRDGIRTYLKQYAYANATTKDLWSALEAASGEPVGDIMDTWILQGGYPLVSVDGKSISQEPFAYTSASGPSAIGSSWQIPVMVRPLGGGPVDRHLLEASTGSIGGNGVSVVNARGSGFYRTAYAPDHLALIATRLDDLDQLERAILFTDTWAAILVGRSDFADLFALAKGLANLDEPSSFDVVATALSLADRIVDDSGREALAGAARALWRPVFSRLGWEPQDGESAQAAELRAMAIRQLGTLGQDEPIVAEALERFDAERVTGDLADAVVAITLGQGRPADVATCRGRQARAVTPQDEQRYLFAPAEWPEPQVVLEVFERVFTDVRTQDAPYLINALMGNRLAGPQVWRALCARWDEAIERFPAMAHVAMIVSVTTFVSDPALASEVRRFHEDHPVPMGQQQVAQVLDLMDLHASLACRSHPTIEGTLRAIGS